MTRIGRHQIQTAPKTTPYIGSARLARYYYYHLSFSVPVHFRFNEFLRSRFVFLFFQDSQLLLWDLELDEIAVPVRRAPGGSPTYSTGSQSAHWDSACPIGTLQPAPRIRDVPKISPLVAHRVHTEPLSGLSFTNESVLTVCREGHIKVWVRPGAADNQTNNAEVAVLSTSSKDKPFLSGKK